MAMVAPIPDKSHVATKKTLTDVSSIFCACAAAEKIIPVKETIKKAMSIITVSPIHQKFSFASLL